MDWSYLERLWVALPLGSIIGVLAYRLWQRYLTRMATVRWSAFHTRVAMAGGNPNVGQIQVLWNGEPVDVIQLCVVEVENESSCDLKNVEVKFAYNDGTRFLDRGTIYGTTQFLPWGPMFRDALERVAANTPPQQDADDVQHLLTRREFIVPVMNRGAKLFFAFIVHTPTDNAPAFVAAVDYLGVRLRKDHQRVMFLGVVQTHAVSIG